MAAVEIRVEVTAPDLSAAISELAQAIGARQGITITPDAVISAPLTEVIPAAHPEPEAYQQLGAYVEKMKQQAAAQPEPAPAPVLVAPMPAPEPQPVPVASMPAPEPQPVPVAPAPAPVQSVSAPAPAPAPAPANITLTQIARAGAALVDHGKKAEVLGALRRYGVQAVTQLKPEQLEQFAADLRALGAQI